MALNIGCPLQYAMPLIPEAGELYLTNFTKTRYMVHHHTRYFYPGFLKGNSVLQPSMKFGLYWRETPKTESCSNPNFSCFQSPPTLLIERKKDRDGLALWQQLAYM